MQKLRATIEQYSHWKILELYVDRIEAHIESDFSHSLENAKALLESIGKEICKSKNVELSENSSVNGVLKKAFSALGYSNRDLVNQVSRSLATIGEEIGNLRNDISPTSHGKSLDELRERNSKVDLLTREFLIDSTLVIALFLIRAFEERKFDTIIKEDAQTLEPIKLIYDELQDFNESWDEAFGEFTMGEYSYLASEILFNVDYNAYETEFNGFKDLNIKADSGEQ
ncbi:MAG: abortive infection family protein [Methylotenera sp.]